MHADMHVHVRVHTHTDTWGRACAPAEAGKCVCTCAHTEMMCLAKVEAHGLLQNLRYRQEVGAQQRIIRGTTQEELLHRGACKRLCSGKGSD